MRTICVPHCRAHGNAADAHRRARLCARRARQQYPADAGFSKAPTEITLTYSANLMNVEGNRA